MRCLFNFICFKRLVLSSVLCAFPLAAVTPPPAYGHIQANGNHVNFGIKIQKLIDKSWKYYKKSDGNSLLEAVLEIKSEVESYTGKKIDANKEIDKIEESLKKKGSKPPKDIFKQFKDLVKKKEKKSHARAEHMEAYFQDQPSMDFGNYEYLHLIDAKQEHGKEQKELPLKFVVGVSLILGGAFVMFATPVCPVLGYAGEIMMSTGLGMMIDQGLDIYQKEY